MKKVLRNKMLLTGLTVIMLVGFFAIIAPFISKAPNQANWDKINSAPSSQFLFGTDSLGRDQLARVAYGVKISFAIGILAALVSVVIGVIWGALAGYLGGKTDYFMMRVVDIMYSLPFMFFVIIMIVFLGRNIFNLFIALGAVQWLTISRIVRAEVLSLKKRDFILAAKSMGEKRIKIIFKHVLPNLLNPVLTYGFLLIPIVMIEEAFLSFLGLGVQAPDASLGTLISDGLPAMETYWWLLTIPAFFLVLLLFGLNYFGEGLRQSLSPTYKNYKK